MKFKMFLAVAIVLALQTTVKRAHASPNCSAQAEAAATAIERINESAAPTLAIPIEEVSVDAGKQELRYEASFNFNVYSVLTDFNCTVREVYMLNIPK